MFKSVWEKGWSTLGASGVDGLGRSTGEAGVLSWEHPARQAGHSCSRQTQGWLQRGAVMALSWKGLADPFWKAGMAEGWQTVEVTS